MSVFGTLALLQIINGNVNCLELHHKRKEKNNASSEDYGQPAHVNSSRTQVLLQRNHPHKSCTRDQTDDKQVSE